MPVKFGHTIINMKVTPEELTKLRYWLQEIDQYMVNSVSSYAKGRRELQLRHSVTLAKSSAKKEAHKVVAIDEATSKKYNSGLIESIGERLLPGFHQALVLHYPKGTLIKIHRDSPAYDKGAATVNIIGRAKLFVSDNQDANNMQSFDLGEGDCINFDNKQPHAIAKVEEDRWCVCFFYVKKDLLPKPSEQLGLFSMGNSTQPQQFKKGDKIKYKDPSQGWVNAIFDSYYTPDLAPKGARWSFMEIYVKGNYDGHSQLVRSSTKHE